MEKDRGEDRTEVETQRKSKSRKSREKNRQIKIKKYMEKKEGEDGGYHEKIQRLVSDGMKG